MKKLAITGAVLAFLCRSEIITLLILAIMGIFLVVILLDAWFKSEPKSLEGSFSKDWGTKKKK